MRRKPSYVSPIFMVGETLKPTTVNVYAETFDPNSYIKSRFSTDALAYLEPDKAWGTLLYRIRVIPHAKG